MEDINNGNWIDKKIKDNYGLEIINVQVLSGGWMNKNMMIIRIV